MNRTDDQITDDELKQWFGHRFRVPDRPLLYLDANADQAVADALSQLEVTFSGAYQRGLEESPSDFWVLYDASKMGAILVSHDEDFAELDERLHNLKLNHAGVILVETESLKNDPYQLAVLLARYVMKFEGATDMLHNRVTYL